MSEIQNIKQIFEGTLQQIIILSDLIFFNCIKENLRFPMFSFSDPVLFQPFIAPNKYKLTT